MNRETIEKLLSLITVLLIIWLMLWAVSSVHDRAEPPAVNTAGLCRPTAVKVEKAELVGKAEQSAAKAAEAVKPIWSETDAVALAQMAWGEIRGGNETEIAQVMWCVLNRVDEWGGTPYSQVTASGQFYGYSSSHPVTDELYGIAVDVLTRWQAEQNGAEVERELSHGYLWFSGDGTHNYFRESYT